MRYLFFLTLLCCSTALAEDLDVCWTAPTMNTDGSPLVDLDGFEIHRGPSAGNYTDVVDLTDETLTCHTTDVPPNTYHVAMKAYDAEGDRSDFSNEVIKLVAANPIPQSPVVLTSDTPVFTVVKQLDRFILLPIGTVPAGTSCDPNQSVNGHGVVPNAEVVWTSPTGPRPVVVVALCQ